jgi:hypothetical protein
VIDGQHRVAAARLAGKKALMCDIRTGLSLQDEARLFDLLNGQRTHVGALDRFRSRLFYEDPVALDINQIVNSLGGTIRPSLAQRKSGMENQITAVRSLERAYDQGGPNFLRELLQIIGDAWEGLDVDTVNEYTVGGLRQFLVRQPKADRDRLKKRLSEEGFAQLRRMAHAHAQIFGGSGPMNFYRAIVEIYNKHLTPGHRLKP